MPPFREFGGNYFTHQILLDLIVSPGFAPRTEPHPFFDTDRANNCPVAAPALIRRWRSMMVFRVFKSPGIGAFTFFPANLIARILVLSDEAPFEPEEMDPDEAA